LFANKADFPPYFQLSARFGLIKEDIPLYFSKK